MLEHIWLVKFMYKHRNTPPTGGVFLLFGGQTVKSLVSIRSLNISDELKNLLLENHRL